MSTTVEQMPVPQTQELLKDMKSELKTPTTTTTVPATELKFQHPLHQFDLTQMSKFYQACVGKLKEQQPEFEPLKWAEKKPEQLTTNTPFNTMVFSSKQQLYDAFSTLARESGEPMILMPNFDYGDILNFERFLQALKQDGVNAIGKYKLYLNNKGMRKFEVDMVVVHPRYGVLLFEVKDCDHLDSKRRSRVKLQLNNARSCFESMGRLIAEAKGWSTSEARLRCTEYVVLPNVLERPVYTPRQSLNQSLNQTGSSSTSTSTRTPRLLTYIIKSDLSSKQSFASWWTKYVVEPKLEQEKLMEEQQKVNKFDLPALNYMLGLINCVRSNSIMPVVYPETDMDMSKMMKEELKEELLKKREEKLLKEQEQQKELTEEEKKRAEEEREKEKLMEKMEKQFTPALNVHGEFFQSEHESVRSLNKVVVVSKDSEKVRKTLCLQTLWFLLNDSQKKISVVCSELNKAYYEEFFARQRKLYNNLNNVRFYSNASACAVAEGSQHTLRKDSETWFFEATSEKVFDEVMDRLKDLTNYWIFTTEETKVTEFSSQLDEYNVKRAMLDFNLEKKLKEMSEEEQRSGDMLSMPWLTGKSMKLPLKLSCDLLVIGDLINLTQLKSLYRYLKSTHVTNYQQTNSRDREPKQQQLSFNPSKKFRSVKFIRGGTIENLKNSLKMHDSLQANVVLMHVGDEDLFKSRNSQVTVERMKELVTLVKEYCPKSFTVVSNLMKRSSRTESTHSNEVNKSLSKWLKEVKDAKEMSHVVYMANSHMEPDYHTQDGGRALNNKGLRMFSENFLYTVDYYMIRNHKQN